MASSRILVRMESLEILTGDGGHTSIVAFSHSCLAGIGCWQNASVPCHEAFSRGLLEYIYGMSPGEDGLGWD